MIGMEINHPALTEPILLPFHRADTLTPDHIFSLIERVAQSKKELRFDQFMTIRAVIVHNPTGAGGLKRRSAVGNLDDWVQSRCGSRGCLIAVRLFIDLF